MGEEKDTLVSVTVTFPYGESQGVVISGPLGAVRKMVKGLHDDACRTMGYYVFIDCDIKEVA